jgi:hypothetical protein
MIEYNPLVLILGFVIVLAVVGIAVRAALFLLCLVYVVARKGIAHAMGKQYPTA